jgi:hypothetical protein
MVGKGDHFIWFLSDRNYPQVWGTRPDPRREQKPMADSLPVPVWRHSTARDQTMHMGMQHQGLAPGVERRNDPRLRAEILGVRQ